VSREIYNELRRLLLSDEPVVLVTVTRVSDGVGEKTLLAAKLLVRPGAPVLGTLGEPELDRVVTTARAVKPDARI
jgi:hypothetical protein